MTMTRAQVLALQTELNAQGFGPLTPDGQYGPDTAAAYRAYLDALDPRTPSLIPPAERPWWAKPALIGGATSVLVALAGLTGWHLDASLLGEILSALATLVAGALALYAGARGEAPLDTRQLAPGVRRVAPGRVAGAGAVPAGPERLPVSPERPADPRGLFSD
jgi:peptidoglycan hydrolase-like protein with peptidoglycan-binding domain